MKVSKILLFTLFLFISLGSFAQTQAEDDEEEKATLNSGSLEGQFDYLYKKAGTYQEYKVIKKTSFYKIKGNVLDSLKALKDDLKETKQLVVMQNSEIDNLKADLKTTNDNLTGVTKEKDNIKFLGISMTKAAYNGILWTIITILVLLLLFFIYRFKNSNSITKQANSLLAETDAEFENFKARALEREQKVRRELQDEINKQKYASKGKTEK
jgi:flagellar motility protein MotE (MotC chaperone)